MQTDQLNGLIALKSVADQRNFRAAAQLLGVSASAVSQAIKQLEQRLGVTLLSRTTRSTRLTEAGEHFLSQAGPALDQILEAMGNIGTYAKTPSGLLRINLPRSLYGWISPIIFRFAKKCPEVTVELFFDDGFTDVVAEGFDAGIRLSEMIAKDMVALRLTEPIRFVVAGSPKYLEKWGRPKHPRDLLSHNCIRMRVGEKGMYDRWEFEWKGKEFKVQVSGKLILNDTRYIAEAATAGAGLIYYPEKNIQDQIASRKLEVVLGQFAATSGGLHLYYPQRSQVLPKLRAFLDHLRVQTRFQPTSQRSTHD